MDYGQGIVQILTGAQNVKQNDIVPVAVVGSTLPPSSRNPEGMKLAAVKMRGLDSFGMLCSADELGIDNKDLFDEMADNLANSLGNAYVAMGKDDVLAILEAAF